MATVKSVILAEEPSWWRTRTIAAEPGKLELSMEGPNVVVRILGDDGNMVRLRARLGGDQLIIGRYDYVVLDSTPAPAPTKAEPSKK